MAKKKFNASMDEEIILALKMQALKEQRDASAILKQLEKEYLKKKENEDSNK